MFEEKFEFENEVLDEDVELEEEVVAKDKSNAEKRRLDRVKKARKKNIESLRAAANQKEQCPEEKRLRKKVAGRKARYSKDEHSFGAYKKCCSMEV